MRAVREKLGLTQEQMSRELKCSISTVTRCERLALVPHNEAVAANFKRLASKAGVSLEAPTTKEVTQ
jgi:ribosome-binding protein aMBF1 (putative translation factor)